MAMTDVLGFGSVRAAFAVLGACALMGCGGGVGAGDYVIFRVALSEAEQSKKCFGDDGEPADTKSDKSTLLTSGTFILYGTAGETDDAYYLDTGAATLEGTSEGDDYLFTGQTVDVNYTKPDGEGDKHTSTTTTSVEMTVDGTSIVGIVEVVSKQKCSGDDCEDTMPDPISCTTTTPFVGTELQDVSLEHGV